MSGEKGQHVSQEMGMVNAVAPGERASNLHNNESVQNPAKITGDTGQRSATGMPMTTVMPAGSASSGIGDLVRSTGLTPRLILILLGLSGLLFLLLS